MPIEYVPLDQMPKRKRRSKIDGTPEWQDVQGALGKGLPKDQSIRVVFTPATAKLFKGEDNAARSFILRLKREFKDFKTRLIGGSVYISRQ